jgi:sugar-specific transcriptional regulator TrmB
MTIAKDLSQKLRDLGLNEYEARAYIALVEIGKASSCEIAAKSGVPYGRIYDILAALVKKGLIVVAPEKPRRWYAHPPMAVLGALIDKHAAELNELRGEIATLTRRYEKIPEETVWVTKGKENFHKIVGRIVPLRKKYDYRIKWDFLYHPAWARNDRLALKRGVDVRTIGPLNDITREQLRNWLKVDKNIKNFPNSGCPVGIVDDEYVFIGLINSDITVMIKDRAFVELMKNLFLTAWKTSPKI